MEDLEQKVKQIIAEQLGKNEAEVETDIFLLPSWA